MAHLRYSEKSVCGKIVEETGFECEFTVKRDFGLEMFRKSKVHWRILMIVIRKL